MDNEKKESDELDEVLNKLKSKVGTKEVSDNPFVSSKEFLTLVSFVARFPKIILTASSGPHEALNGIESILMTFLKNIPDNVWEVFKKLASDPANASKPASVVFFKIDAIRSWDGGNLVEFRQSDESDEMPPINSPMPNKPV